MILHIAELHFGDAVQKLREALVTLGYSRTELIAIHVKVIE